MASCPCSLKAASPSVTSRRRKPVDEVKGPGNGRSTEGIAVPSSTDAHLRLQDALGLPPVIRSHTGPPARSTVITNSKKGQHRRSLATNFATASSTFLSEECLKA